MKYARREATPFLHSYEPTSRRAEVISPQHVHRDPFVREALAGLVARSRRDAPAARELRRMAYQAGLPV